MKFVHYVGTNQLASTKYRSAISNNQNVLVDGISAKANIAVNLNLDGKPLTPSFSGSTLDLFDIGAFVYLVDEMFERSQTTNYWTRSLDCLIPVNDLSVWRKNHRLLQKILGFLSGDSWRFEWVHFDSPLVQHSHRQGLPEGFDAVCLFSGGTDSLMGSLQLLDAGRKVLLVGHQSEGQTASAQTALANELRKIYKDHLCFVQCRVSKSPRRMPTYSLPLEKENSHRIRSFLFLALGTAIAAQCGIMDVFMPENGFMALNVPIQKSRVGALSTRTAHPAFIIRFSALVRNIGIFAGNIKNPFITQSKTDMLRGLNPSLRSLILRSTSCSKPSRYNNLGVRHCGYCIPCIHRRIAFMEAGIDRAEDYAFDVFGGMHSLPLNKQQDFRALVRFAEQVATATPAWLENLILSHGYFPSNTGSILGTSPTLDYGPWVQMLKRWADDFCSKIRNRTSSTV